MHTACNKLMGNDDYYITPGSVLELKGWSNFFWTRSWAVQQNIHATSDVIENCMRISIKMQVGYMMAKHCDRHDVDTSFDYESTRPWQGIGEYLLNTGNAKL